MSSFKTPLQRRVFGVVVLLCLFAAACVPVPIGKSWADISVVEVYGEPAIMLAFVDRLALINPQNGAPVELRDSEGNIRRDPNNNNVLVWQVVSGQPNGPVPEGLPVEFYTAPLPFEEDTLLAVGYSAHIYTINIPAARVEAPTAGIPVVAGLANEYNKGHTIIPPILTEDTLYLGFTEQNFIALDVTNNFTERWRFTTERGIWGKPLLVAESNTLYIPGMDHHLFAVDAETGVERWRLDLGGAVAGMPVYHNGYLFVGSFDRKLFMIRTPDAVDGGETGEIAAVYETQGWVWGSPTLDDSGILYAADLEGYVYALRVSYPGSNFGSDDADAQDVETGFTEIWKTRAAERGIRPSPLVTKDFVIVGSRDHSVYWLSRETGEVSFRQQLTAEILSDILLIPAPAASTEDSTNETTAEPQTVINPYGDVTQGLVVVSSMNFQELLVGFNLETSARNWGYGR